MTQQRSGDGPPSQSRCSSSGEGQRGSGAAGQSGSKSKERRRELATQLSARYRSHDNRRPRAEQRCWQRVSVHKAPSGERRRPAWHLRREPCSLSRSRRAHSRGPALEEGAGEGAARQGPPRDASHANPAPDSRRLRSTGQTLDVYISTGEKHRSPHRRPGIAVLAFRPQHFPPTPTHPNPTNPTHPNPTAKGTGGRFPFSGVGGRMMGQGSRSFQPSQSNHPFLCSVALRSLEPPCPCCPGPRRTRPRSQRRGKRKRNESVCDQRVRSARFGGYLGASSLPRWK